MVLHKQVSNKSLKHSWEAGKLTAKCDGQCECLTIKNSALTASLASKQRATCQKAIGSSLLKQFSK